MAAKQTPEKPRQPNPGPKPRRVDGEAVNEDLDDELPPYAAGEGLDDDLLGDEDFGDPSDQDDDPFARAGKRKN